MIHLEQNPYSNNLIHQQGTGSSTPRSNERLDCAIEVINSYQSSKNFNPTTLQIIRDYAEEPDFLDWTLRSQEIQTRISDAFKAVSQKHTDNAIWNFNGSKRYNLCGIDEYKLAITIIKEALLSGRKEITILDVGAGKCRLGRSLADLVNEEFTLSEDVTIHIISVTGEQLSDEKVVKLKQCKLYNLGGFKVEHLRQELIKRGFSLDGNIAFIISRLCLQHLVDPVGTFLQLYYLLMAKTGFLLMDGFYFFHENDTLDINTRSGNLHMMRLLLDTKAPFVMKTQHSVANSLNHFLLQRPNDKCCQLPMRYKNIFHFPHDNPIGSDCITIFERVTKKDEPELTSLNDYSHYGDKSVYLWLKNNDLFSAPLLKWEPIYSSNEDPPLFCNFINGKIAPILESLKNGIDIDEPNCFEETPLMLSLKYEKFFLFKDLLNRGANVTFVDAIARSALHYAAKINDGRFTQLLLEKGALIDAENENKKTALDIAIAFNNIAATEILLQNKANVSPENEKQLRRSVFAPLWGKVEPTMSNNALMDVHNWIDFGDCVVLHNAGKNRHIYHKCDGEKETSLSAIRVIYIDIVQGSGLLKKDEWPEELKRAGHHFCACSLKGRVTNPVSIPNLFAFEFGLNLGYLD